MFSDETLRETLERLSAEIENSDLPAHYAKLHTLLNRSSREMPCAMRPQYHLAALTIGNYVSIATSLSQEIEENFELLFNSVDFAGIFQELCTPQGLPLPFLIGSSAMNARFIVFDDPALSDEAFTAFCLALHKKLQGMSNLPSMALIYHPGQLTDTQLYPTASRLSGYYRNHYRPWSSMLMRENEDKAISCSYAALDLNAVIQAFQIRHYDTSKRVFIQVLKSWYDMELPVLTFYRNMLYLLQSLRHRAPEHSAEEQEQLMLDTNFCFFFSRSFEDFCEQQFRLLAIFFHMQKSSWSVDDLLEGVKLYIDEHYQMPINICDLAAQFYISPSHLSRQFKMRFGCTPSNYLIDKRISQACVLLREEPDLKTEQISSMVGYNDQFHFSKIFKKRTGQTPSEYRKNAP